MMNLRIKITILQRTYKSYPAMKRYLTPAIVTLGFFAFIYAILASTDRSTGIALFGAGYATFLIGLYILIPSINNSGYNLWSPIPDDATPAQRWSIAIGNFIVCMTICWSTFELPEESLSDISIVKFILFAVLAAAAGYFVRRMIAAK